MNNGGYMKFLFVMGLLGLLQGCCGDYAGCMPSRYYYQPATLSVVPQSVVVNVNPTNVTQPTQTTTTTTTTSN